jgi:hypothetical protein
MSELHQALEALRPKDFGEVPVDEVKSYLSDLFRKAELIANSVPPPPNGTPYESAKRTRTDANGATSAADITVSNVRRPPPPAHQAELQKSWGKPLKLGAKDAATGISVFKMAGHDRHGAWFARTSVHEGLGFAKWRRAMMREFPESLAVQGGPGEGNVRGIGGDKRLEDIEVKGIGKVEGIARLLYPSLSLVEPNYDSVPIVCTVPRPNSATRIHYSPHYIRQRPHRRFQNWQQDPQTLHGSFNTSHAS